MFESRVAYVRFPGREDGGLLNDLLGFAVVESALRAWMYEVFHVCHLHSKRFGIEREYGLCWLPAVSFYPRL